MGCRPGDMHSMATPSFLPSSLERFVQLSGAREHAIAANMANVDTPGYRTKDLDFRTEMARASTAEASDVAPAVGEVRGLLERPDGNNVNLDRESLLLAQTQLQYQVGVQLIKGNFHELLSAINGGS